MIIDVGISGQMWKLKKRGNSIKLKIFIILKKKNHCMASIEGFPGGSSICHEVMGPDAMILVF